MMMMMIMIISPFIGQLGRWALSSEARDVFTLVEYSEREDAGVAG
jgi:hypothetical protein